MMSFVSTGSRVRAAQAGDCRFLAEVMYESMLPGVGRGLFDGALEDSGVEPVAFNEHLLLSGVSNWGGIDDFLVIETNEEPLAGAAGAYVCSDGDRRPLTGEGFQKVSRSLGWPPQTARAFWSRYVRVFGLFGNAPQFAQPAPYVIEYVAVREPLRGQGLGGRLVQAQVERARAQGHRAVAISAMYGNEAALRAYRRQGFEEHARLDPEVFGGAFPGIVRLRLDLGPHGPGYAPADRLPLPWSEQP